MKTSFIFNAFFLLILLFYGCSKESLVGVTNYNSTNGSVFLKIGKSTIPPEVLIITVKLSRLNYDTLHASINATNDSLISFNNVPVGNWHMEADAKNSEDRIIYTGEADVIILEDETVDVYITLIPVGSGTGNINIFVNWGNNWSDFYENPIYTPYDSPNNPLAITQPKVIYDNGVYKMWYLNLYNSAKSDIWYAESEDGINWHSTQNSPVITPGDSDSWDDYSVAPGAVFKEGNYLKMYYNGFHDQYGKWNIGMAVSSDGIHWEKNSEPVLTASDEEYQIGVSSVVIYNQTYYMFYSVRHYPYYNICLATSSDGIHWTKYENNPILSANKDWEGTGIYSPSVIYTQEKFEMIYMNAGASAFGVAYSFDGINWNKEDTPVFTSDDTYNKWASRIAYPNLSNINSELKLYYTGYKNYADGTIALATKPQ